MKIFKFNSIQRIILAAIFLSCHVQSQIKTKENGNKMCRLRDCTVVIDKRKYVDSIFPFAAPAPKCVPKNDAEVCLGPIGPFEIVSKEIEQAEFVQDINRNENYELREKLDPQQSNDNSEILVQILNSPDLYSNFDSKPTQSLISNQNFGQTPNLQLYSEIENYNLNFGSDIISSSNFDLGVNLNRQLEKTNKEFDPEEPEVILQPEKFDNCESVWDPVCCYGVHLRKKTDQAPPRQTFQNFCYAQNDLRVWVTCTRGPCTSLENENLNSNSNLASTSQDFSQGISSNINSNKDDDVILGSDFDQNFENNYQIEVARSINNDYTDLLQFQNNVEISQYQNSFVTIFQQESQNFQETEDSKYDVQNSNSQIKDESQNLQMINNNNGYDQQAISKVQAVDLSNDCFDVVADNFFTCEQQKGFGKCGADWMLAGNFCRKTCGRCPWQFTSQQKQTSYFENQQSQQRKLLQQSQAVCSKEAMQLPTCCEEYIVQARENIKYISQKFDVSVKDLLVINGMDPDEYVAEGDILQIC